MKIPYNLIGRNPFTFSGHFKSSIIEDAEDGYYVAIPSLFQGISSLLERQQHYSTGVAIPSLFQGISRNNQLFGFPLDFRSQSLHFFRAFQAEEVIYQLLIGTVAIPSLFQGISRAPTHNSLK